MQVSAKSGFWRRKPQNAVTCIGRPEEVDGNGAGEGGPLPVNLSTVPNINHQHRHDVILNLSNYPIVPDTPPPQPRHSTYKGFTPDTWIIQLRQITQNLKKATLYLLV